MEGVIKKKILTWMFFLICINYSVFSKEYYQLFYVGEPFFIWKIQQVDSKVYLSHYSWLQSVQENSAINSWSFYKTFLKGLCAFHVVSEQDIWYGTYDNKFNLLLKDGNEIDILNKLKFDLKNPIYKIECDSNQNLWFCTIDGVWELNRKTEVITNIFPSLSSELKDSIKIFKIDKNNVKWFCTKSGIYSYDGNKLEKLYIDSISLKDPLHLFWMQMKFDKFGNKWFSSLNGLYKYDGSKWENFNTKNSNLTNDSLLDFDWDKGGQLWVSTFRELIQTNLLDSCIIYEKFNPNKYPNYSLRKIWFDNYNNMWQVLYYWNDEDGPSYEVLIYNKDKIFANGTEENDPTKLLIYPNPVTDLACLQLDNVFSGFASISIVDLLGNSTKIYQGEVSADIPINLDFSAFSSGFYSLIIDYGTRREVVKVIKE